MEGGEREEQQRKWNLDAKWYALTLCQSYVTQFIFRILLQAGMIRTEQEEFFIEPVERGDGMIEEEQEGGVGRTHIVYRSSAVKKAPINSVAADYHSRG